MKLGVQQKKVTVSDSAKPHTYIFFDLRVTSTCRNGAKSEKVCDAFLLASISPYITKVHGHFWLKFGRVLSVYGALMLLNFC